MCDFLVLEMEDPFGFSIDGGEVVKVDRHGEVEWATACKRMFEGSGGARMAVRSVVRDAKKVALATPRYLPTFQMGHASPAKFLTGHNLFGSADVPDLAFRCLDRVAQALERERPCYEPLLFDRGEVGRARISRIDLAGHWLLPRESDVLPFLSAIQEHCVMPYRGRGIFGASDPGTLYYGYKNSGERAGDWALKLYAKGREFAKNTAKHWPAEALAIPGLLDEINRTVRVEVTLRTAELKRLGLRKVQDWTEEKAAQVWQQYVERLDMEQLSLDLGDIGRLPMKPRLRDAVNAWKAGTDLREGRSPASFYRLRKEIKEATGYDIKAPMPKSNVTPLIRTVEAIPAPQPAWAADLTEALRRAA